MKIFGMCINKNVVAGLAVVALGIWWMAPEAIGAALPFLLLAICPLSMLFMMKAMNNMGGQQQAQQTGDASAQPPAPAGPGAHPVAGQLALSIDSDDPVDAAPAR